MRDMAMQSNWTYPIKYALRKLGFELRRIPRTDDLTWNANRFNSDKGTRQDAHHYTIHYQELFRMRRLEYLTFVELGLLRTDDPRRIRRPRNAAEGTSSLPAYDAPSLRMWRSYFPNAKIIGFDIDDFSSVEIGGCTIIRGDVSSPADLDRIVQAANGKIDIIIDDASHASHHQQIALCYLFPRLAPKGLYIIEDMHWQEDDFERPEAPRTRDLLRYWQIGLTLPSPYLSVEEQRGIQSQLTRLRLFDSRTALFADPTDALAILTKR
jgi:hypothetical protein